MYGMEMMGFRLADWMGIQLLHVMEFVMAFLDL
jgi:hypothetical protein